MKNTFVISCPIDTYSGYGARARDFVKSIVELDKYDVKYYLKDGVILPKDLLKDNKKEWGVFK